MTKDRLVELLKDPSLLATISYEELKTLALSYPYAHNLRVLLATKSQQEGHPNFKQDLATAAMYSLDRRRLFQVVAPKILAPQPVKVEKHEEVLQLKPIEQVQESLKAKLPQAEILEVVKEAEPQILAQKLPLETLPKTKVESTFIPPSPPNRDPNVVFDFSETLRQKHTMRQKEASKPIETKIPSPATKESQEIPMPKEVQSTIASEAKIKKERAEENLVFNRAEKTILAEKAEKESNFPPSLSVLERLLEEPIKKPDNSKPKPQIVSAESLLPSVNAIEEDKPFELAEALPTEALVVKNEIIDTVRAFVKEAVEKEKAESPLMEVQQIFVPAVQAVVLSPVSFGSWASGFNLPILEKREPEPKEFNLKSLSNLAIGEDEEGIEEEQFNENDVKEQNARYFAARSVEESSGLVSETLAKLYVRQGHKDKAIAMYERLYLAFPEKKLFFAAEIEKLKN